MATDAPEFVIINAPPGIKESRRVLKSGKRQRRFSVVIGAEPIVHVFDSRDMGRGPAEAITGIMQDRLVTNDRKVSAAAVDFRNVARRAFDRGERWAMKRYAGGRIGPKRPIENSERYAHDSGRLAEHMFARFDRSISAWNVHPPANRLNPNTFGNPNAFEAFLEGFADIIDIKSILTTNTFKNAQAKALSNAIQVTRGRLQATQMKLLRELLGTFRAAGGVVTAVL